MIDITNELAAIQAATTGSQIRSSIISALQTLNNNLPIPYSGSYYFVPSSSSFSILTSGKTLYSDILIESYQEAILISGEFSENGIYHASDFSADGFDSVIISVPSAVLSSYLFSLNGIYSASEYSVDGFDSIEVDVRYLDLVQEAFHDSNCYAYISTGGDFYHSNTSGCCLTLFSVKANHSYVAVIGDTNGNRKRIHLYYNKTLDDFYSYLRQPGSATYSVYQCDENISNDSDLYMPTHFSASQSGMAIIMTSNQQSDVPAFLRDIT